MLQHQFSSAACVLFLLCWLKEWVVFLHHLSTCLCPRKSVEIFRIYVLYFLTSSFLEFCSTIVIWIRVLALQGSDLFFHLCDDLLCLIFAPSSCFISCVLGVLLFILQKHELSYYFMDICSLIWWKLLVICPLPRLGWQVVTIRGWRSPTLWGEEENQFSLWGLCGGGFENFSNVKELAKLSELLLYSTQGSFCIYPFWRKGCRYHVIINSGMLS